MRRNLVRLIVLMGVVFFHVQVTTAQRVLTLKQALNTAFENSPEIRKSRIYMEQNKLYLIAQKASLKSKFSLDVTPFEYRKEDSYNEYFSKWNNTENKGSNGSFSILQPIAITDGKLLLRNQFGYQDNTSQASGSYTGYNNSLYLQYDQPIFTYNRIKMELKRNKMNLENATLAYSITMLSKEREVTEAFYAIYQKQMGLKIAREEFENQKVSLDIIASKVEGGLSAKEELFQAQLNLSTSKSSLENQKVELENSMDLFRKLLGISLDEDINVETDIDYLPVIVDLKKAIDNGLSQRMELTQRKIDFNKAKFDLIERQAANEFKGNVKLSVGVMGNDSQFKNIYNKPTKSPEVGITFSIPVFDWGARKARVKAAQLEVTSKQIDMETLKDDIVINIRKVYRNLQNLINQIDIAKQNQKNATLTYEINLERYKNGDLTSMDLGRFQNQLSEKKMKLTNSLISYKLELLNMRIQSLWDFEHNCSFVPQELQDNIIE